MKFREEVFAADAVAVGKLVTATGFFSPAEAAIATDLVETRIAQGPASGIEDFYRPGDGKLIYRKVLLGPDGLN